MAEETDLESRLADLAASGRRHAVPPAAEQVRARGDRRRRRKRAARASGGVVTVAALALGILSVVGIGPGPAPPAAPPTAAASVSPFMTPTPARGEEYAAELGSVYDAVPLKGNMVQVTVAQVHPEKGVAVRTGAVHELTLKRETPVEVKHAVGGTAKDVRAGELVEILSGGPQWVFAVDYDGEGRVQSLREAYWLTVE
ncbi:hypothetical protein PV376_31865 [Streptomyces sp. NRRL_ISP-5395]|uniref:hypothetical protein n=1 Tax=Streptomyces TaxID=1883 RepID=UPI00187654FE|nr:MULTISPECIES: hypothetical protein [Streptomyces]MDX2674110.1 hypothetical protein [Streptomyces sp. NRRL_ISP-5395]GHF70315.1 hypothetical protein GCM10010504_43340 [Streptomyces griseus]